MSKRKIRSGPGGTRHQNGDPGEIQNVRGDILERSENEPKTGIAHQFKKDMDIKWESIALRYDEKIHDMRDFMKECHATLNELSPRASKVLSAADYYILRDISDKILKKWEETI